MKYMDVTFREARHVEALNPDERHVFGTLGRLRDAGIDYVEPSYIQPPTTTGRGLFWEYNEAFFTRIAEIFEGTRTKLAVMLQPEGFQPGLYSDRFFQDVSMVRLACTRADVSRTANQVDYFKSRGAQVAVNLTRANQYPAHQCVEAMKEAEGNGADIFYLADTNGTMLPEETRRYVSELRNRTNMLLGFHPHDNMGFAEANALEAINSGAEFIDGSLLGFGKGAGNARTEKMLVLFERLKLGGYSSSELYPAIRYFFENVYGTITGADHFAEQYRFILYALRNITLATDKRLKELARVKSIDELDFATRLVFEFKGDFDALQASLEKDGQGTDLTV